MHCFSLAFSSLICTQAFLKHRNASVTHLTRCSFHTSIWQSYFTEEIILCWTDYSTSTQSGHWFSSPAHLFPSQCGKAEPYSCLSAPSWGAKGNTSEPGEELLSSWGDEAAYRAHQHGHISTQIPFSLFLWQLKLLHRQNPPKLCWRWALVKNFWDVKCPSFSGEWN